MPDLPEFFILYNPSRGSQSDPYSGLCYVRADKVGTAYTLQALPAQPNIFPIQHVPDGKKGHYTHFGHVEFTLPNVGTTVNKAVSDWTLHFQMKPSAASPTSPLLPVLEIRPRPGEHFPQMLKRNFAVELASAGAPPSISLSGPPSANPIPTPPTPTVIRKVRPNLQALNPHVAKQLLTLAKNEKSMCPITAEEFVEGHTAAMPCGHLFMRIAIEESFKVKNNECPLCRLAGQPVYI
jgi:hypothetical protein